MKSAVRMTVLVGLALVFSGCGSKPDRLVQKQIALMNEMADEIESGGSEDDIKQVRGRLEENSKKLEELDLSEEEITRLKEKYEDEMSEAMGRMMKASMSRAAQEIGKKIPGLPKLGS